MEIFGNIDLKKFGQLLNALLHKFTNSTEFESSSSEEGAFGYDESNGKIIYRDSNGVKTVATMEDTAGSTYESSIADGVLTAEPWGDIPPGTDVASLKNREISSLIDQALFPTVEAYIGSNRSLTVNNMSTSTLEVGTTYSDASLDIVFNPGQIRNGDGSLAGQLVGDLNRVVIKNPDGVSIVDDSSTGGNSVNKALADFEVKQGNNTYTFEVYNDAGTTTYTDNKGGIEALSSIETAKANVSVLSTTKSVPARYYYYKYLGARDSHPTDSVSIRVLSKTFLDSNNNASIFQLNIPANTSEIVIYTIIGKTVSANNPATNETLTVTQSAMSIDDAGGNSVNYTKNIIDLGLNGFSSDATFNITIG